MGWGFRRRKGLLGGLVNLNLSKRGVGASVGVPGLRVGVDSQRRGYVRGGVPGTGLYFTQSLQRQSSAGFWAAVVSFVLGSAFILWMMLR